MLTSDAIDNKDAVAPYHERKPCMMSTSWKIKQETPARWIFPEIPAESVNQIVDFLHPFHCEDPDQEAAIRISADSDFICWMNGALLGFGQYSNHPDRKSYERFDLAGLLRPGRNTLAFTVFYNGRTSSVYRRGDPGLLFQLTADDKTLAASGKATLSRPNPCYHSGSIAIVSGQLSFIFGYDARHEDDFFSPDYQPGESWCAIGDTETAIPPDRTEVMPRPVPRLVDAGSTRTCLINGGTFKLDREKLAADFGFSEGQQESAGLAKPDGTHVSPGWLIEYALLSASLETITATPTGTDVCVCSDGMRVKAERDDSDGIFLLFDMGREEAGHLELEIESAPGTIVDIGYGEHIDDGHVRAFVGGRTFAGRYICGSGKRRFLHPFLRWAGRYLQVHVYGDSFVLHHIALRRMDYPLATGGVLDTKRVLHDKILETGKRTLHLCMHEHYEDTPWREQALYANDARTQALCGYYAFGETAMPAASFTLLGQGLREDGFLYLTAPGRPGITIPSFTFTWILAVRDHLLYSGDAQLARTFLPQILAMLRRFIGERKQGLMPLRREKRTWHFYDWSAGMSAYSEDLFAKGLEADAPLNCFLLLAIEATIQMLDWLGEEDRDNLPAVQAEIRDAVAATFWDKQDDTFRTHLYTADKTELTQALAILAGVGDDAMRDRALARMGTMDSGLLPPGLSQSHYTFAALMTRKKWYGAKQIARMEETWGGMLDAGATTFWETVKGASDFSYAGSLCHGWSAVPIYVFYHDLLGVRPLAPGFSRFAVDPMTDVCSAMSGRVPVPGGEIVVAWEGMGDEKGQLRVDAPANITRVSNAGL